jgi:dihydroorotase
VRRLKNPTQSLHPSEKGGLLEAIDMRKVELKIINTKLLVGDDLIEAGVAIEGGKIVKIAKDPNLPDSDTTMDAKGLLMLPGVVDIHVHLRDLDLSYKEDFSSGTQAAVMGGVTTVLDMPNTSPRTADAHRLKEKVRKATSEVYCNVGFFGELAFEPDETRKMLDQGAIGFKLYLNEPRNNQLRKEKIFVEATQPIRLADSTLSVHAEFPSVKVEESTPRDERSQIEQFIRSHDPQLEMRAVSKCIESAKESGLHIHICHISTEAALSMINQERVNGTHLTAEVTPHHLLLSEAELYRNGSYAKMVPPLRRLSDVRSMFRGLVNGNLDAIASDHAPHSNEEKSQTFAKAPPGVPGLETMLPLLLTEVSRGTVPLRRIVQALCENPPELFGIKDRGRIAEGYNADLILVDLAKEKTIDPRTFVSKAKFTPFEGRKVKGVPVLTIVNGVPVAKDGEIIGKPGDGRIVKPTYHTQEP